MPNETSNSREIQAAFAEYDRQETISNFKVACIIGMTLMPAGVILDLAVYPGLAPQFLKLRLLSSALIAAFLAVLLTPTGRKHYRFLGITLFMLPAHLRRQVASRGGALSGRAVRAASSTQHLRGTDRAS